MTIAQVTEPIRQSVEVLDQAGEHGPAVWLAVFIIIVFILVGLFVGTAILKFIIQPIQKQGVKESEERIETMKKQSEAMNETATTLRELVTLSTHQTDLHKHIKNQVEQLVEESRQLVLMHSDETSVFATTQIEKNLLAMMEAAKEAVMKCNVDLDPILLGNLDRAIRQSRNRTGE